MNIILHPNLYHGKNKKDNFFEGWYFKIVTKDRKHTLAIIPGISLSKDSHSFIQVLQGEKNLYNYIRYPTFKFSYSNSPFSVNIDQSSFSFKRLLLNIRNENLKIIGALYFDNLVPWKDSTINPGSMGFYNYLKFMECYSQVCALDGDIQGVMTINDELIDFHGGKVYIEKNWGRSFPVEWLWVQSNTFKDSRATVTCSLGEIPFPLKNFRGFLIGVTVDNIFFPFTTMNRSKLDLKIENNDILLTVIHKNLRLSIKTITDNNSFILCYGPQDGQMVPFVRETLTAKVEMELVDIKNNVLIYSGESSNTGVEFGGNLMY
ncbi:Uncharacterised protein [uncultured Clostridium sp.]|uniref:tocopherol cyclase family protein n=1 Tax=uncultured Clostridium sp. TaxID=59620 RepID=UPI00082108DA|nr:tocopherol cyclase family protein [uncultured Clostridium sp.]SCJ61327.1 Uncharacterised protein [uncultured Clostridium sp.]